MNGYGFCLTLFLIVSASLIGTYANELQFGPDSIECSDQVDNDGDGLVDWQNDLGCSGSTDNTETAITGTSTLTTSMRENGWTTFDFIPGNQIIYVSCTGNDLDDGLSPFTAVRSVNRGLSLLRDGSSDWLLFQRGCTWGAEVISIAKSGRSSTQPIIISAYGEGVRPKFNEGALRFWFSPVQNIFVSGLHFYGESSDPTSPNYNSSATLSPWFDILQPVHNATFEDLKGEFFDTGRLQSASSRITIRRSLFLDGEASGDFVQGLYIDQTDAGEILIEENYFDNPKWNYNNETPNFIGTQSHNLYIQSSDLGQQFAHFTINGNVFSRARSHGLQARQGGDLNDNLFLENAINLLFGGSFTIQPVTGSSTNDVFIESRDIRQPDQLRGWGIDFEHTGIITITNALLAWNKGHLQRHFTPTNLQGLVIINNSVIYQWGHFENISECSYVGLNFILQNNYLWNSGSAPCGNNLNANTANFSEPNRTVATYMSSLGFSGNNSDFYNEFRKQARIGSGGDSWRNELTAPVINNYIRQGYDIGSGGGSNNSGGSSGGESGGSSSGSGGGGGRRSFSSTLTSLCNDNLDNDGDDLIDYPNDLGCSNANDNSELNDGELGSESKTFTEESETLKSEDFRIEINLLFWIILILIVSGIILIIIYIIRFIRLNWK